jgi:nitrate/nitrite transport system substrate-binding protein
MSSKSLGNPFDGDISLSHKKDCGCVTCNAAHKGVDLTSEKQSRMLFEKQAQNSIQIDPSQLNTKQPAFGSSDDMMGQVIENAIVRGVFGQSELGRRNFMKMVGSSTAAAVIGSMLPIEKAKAAVMDTLGKLEKTKLNIGFVPITCATPIIMAKPMGFYEKYGLDVNVIKTAGWAVARDKSLAGEYDAAHMLTPMPLAMTMGAGSSPEPYIMPAIENINGQAIVLHVKHKDKRDPTQWKGFKFGVPFE